VFNKTLLASTADRDVAWVNNSKLLCFTRLDGDRDQKFAAAWGKTSIPGVNPLWQADCQDSVALALCRNAVVLVRQNELVALDLEQGRTLWTQRLAAPTVPWGLAVDRDGRVIVTAEGGRVFAFGQNQVASR
jgi:outer membrane protein assembly factor BamB